MQKIYDQQIELREDNDFLNFTDRYYTTGTFIGYRKLLKKETDSTDKQHYGIFIFQEIYTPSELLETNVNRFDRPFAGFLGFSNEISYTNHRRHIDFGLVLGVTGPISAAEALQSLFHETATEDSRIATWQDQIENAGHINLYFKYTREWELKSPFFDFYFVINPSTAIGSRDVYFQNDIVFYFGNRNNMTHSIAYKQLGSLKKELFFGFRTGYRHVLHDATLEGSLFIDNSPFTLPPTKNIYFLSFEMYYRLKRNDIKLTYNFESKRTERAEAHSYISLSYSRSF